MQTIRDRLSQLTLGETRRHQMLAMAPLLATEHEAPDYFTLDEALDRSELRITEVSEGGSVPELRLTNDASQAVLLVDGEELVGAKQNRILNLSLLAPAGKTLIIPVSCVEARRWSHVSREFRSEKRAFFSSGRARKAGDVTESLRSAGSRSSDQGEVWRRIAAKFECMDVRSATDAMDCLYQDFDAQLAEYVAALPAEAGQVGALFSINGAVCGLDLFDFSATLSKLLPKLIVSYALDAIETADVTEGASHTQPADFLSDIMTAPTTVHPSVGEGEDVRLSGAGLTGGALVARGRVIHLCAFRQPLEDPDRHEGLRDRMASASMRRRRQMG
jgi:hypothetical protein